MKGYLLDVNVLIALLWPSHAQHERAMEPGSVRTTLRTQEGGQSSSLRVFKRH